MTYITYTCINCAHRGRYSECDEWWGTQRGTPAIVSYCDKCKKGEERILYPRLIDLMIKQRSVVAIKSNEIVGIFSSAATARARAATGLQYDYLRPVTRADIESFFFPPCKFAIVPKNGDGPVWGVGNTEEEAWADASTSPSALSWEPDEDEDENEGTTWDSGLECRECTPALARMSMMFCGDVHWAFLKDGRVGLYEEKEKEVGTH